MNVVPFYGNRRWAELRVLGTMLYVRQKSSTYTKAYATCTLLSFGRLYVTLCAYDLVMIE